MGYWLCFGITYGYNAYFWDNSVAKNLMPSALLWWLFGLLTVSLTVLFSVLTASNTGVLMGTGGVILSLYLIGMIPKVGKYLPTALSEGTAMIYGYSAPREYTVAALITAILCVVFWVVSIPIFNKKQL